MGYSFKNLLTNVVPKGTYKFSVEKMEFVPSTKDPSIYNAKVTLRITEGTQAKRTVLDTISTAFPTKLSAFLKAAGVDMAKEFATMQEMYAYGIKEAVGKTLMADISIRKYNGNDYNQVDDYKPLPGSSTSAEDVLKTFGDVSGVEMAPAKPTLEDLEVSAPEETAEEPAIDINLDDVL